jgi:hypothetical protein
MDKKLPIFDVVINDDTQGVGMISLVDEPAIGVNWIKLAKQAELTFKTDKQKQLLYGPFLIPNMLIYRNDDINGEYYVRFSKEQIEKIATKFNEDLNNKNINFMHTERKVEAFVAQNWLIEGEQDKSRSLKFDLPEGTWFGAVKIKDLDFWENEVQNNEVKGFSVEVLADLELNLKNKNRQMKRKLNFATATLQDGTIVYYDGELSVGTAIFIDEAMTEPAPDADHVAEDGTIITTVDGVVTEIKPVEVEEEVEAGKNKKKENMEIDPNTGQELPTQITPEEVSMMIDNRFGELMEEITRLKIMIEKGEGEVEEFKKQVNEKFSVTPAVKSIKKPEPKLDSKFSQIEARVKSFAKIK